MTPRRRLALLAVVVALAVLAMLRLRGNGPAPSSAPAHHAKAPPATNQPTHARARPRLPRRYRDRTTRLGLRGRVVTLTGRAVAGAVVRMAGLESRKTMSDDRGSFAFDGLAAGSYFLTAATDSSASSPRHVHLGPDTKSITLRVFASASLTVSVVSLDGNVPIEGAQVLVLPDRKLGNTPVRSGVTASDGTATLRSLAPASYSVVATAPGYRSAETPMPPQAGLQWKATMRLLRGAAVRGTVVDRAGNPVVGAAIVPFPAGLISAYSPRPRASPRLTISDDRGEFTIPALEAGEFVLRATHPAYQAGHSDTLRTDGKSTRDGVKIVVEPGAVISGRVVDRDGLAEPFAEVRINAADVTQKGAGVRFARTDRNGTFTVEGLPKIPVELVATAEGGTSLNIAFDLAETPAVRGAEIRIDLDGVIAGVVTNADGTPIQDAEVVCVGPSLGAIGLRPVTTESTNEQGEFACAGLAPGPHALTARRPYANNNQSPWMRSVGVSANPGDDVRLVLPGDGSVSGRVARAGGGAVTEFQVAIDGSGAPMRVRSSDGRFTLDGLAPRQYTLRVTVGARTVSRAVQVPEGGTADVGVVTIP